MSITIHATADVQDVINKIGRPGGVDKIIYDTFLKKLADPAGKVERKGEGLFGIDLPDGKRSLFVLDTKGNPVLVYLGDHKGYDKIWKEMMQNPEKFRQKFLSETSEIALNKSDKYNITQSELKDKLRSAFGLPAIAHHTPSSEHHNGHGGGRVGRIAAAVGVVVVAIGATDSARAETSTGAALVAAGREIGAALIPFTGAVAAAADGKITESIVSFIGDCSWIGMGASEALRPMLRAIGADVAPGAIEDALANRPPTMEDVRKRPMMDMVKDIPAMSVNDLALNKVPYGPVYQVALQKYEIKQEMAKIEKMMKGRTLDDLSPEEADKYARSVGKIQACSRDIKNIWSREVENKLGPSQNYGTRDPVQVLRDQVAENLSRGPLRSKSMIGFSSSEYVQDDKMSPINLVDEFTVKTISIAPVEKAPELQTAPKIEPPDDAPPTKQPPKHIPEAVFPA